jgi:TorA maturation chaperone TorD
VELFRTLGALAEPPAPGQRALAELLELGPPPGEADHSDLFLFQLYPYASVYLGAEGMLGGEARDRVAGFWRALGQAPPAEPDHLAALLALYARLAELEAAAGDASGRERWRHARKALCWEHLASWLPVYLVRLAELAPPFYRRWGEVLAEALAGEAATLGPPAGLPLHLRAAPAMVDPRAGDGEAFLAALLAPARSGLILVRSDLARAARELNLGTRIGERKFVLRALLGQDGPATLGWLAAEARRQAGLHRGLPAPFVRLAAFWTARAEAAATLLGELAIG